MPALLCEAQGHVDQALAGDGLRVCWAHADGIERDVLDAVRLHGELLQWQAWRSPGDAPAVSGTREKLIPIDPRKVEARAQIEVTLISWAKLVLDERGWNQPAAATVLWAGTLVMSSSRWLAAHELAVQCCDELRELSHGWVRSVARPTGSVRTPAGVCPLCKAPAVGIIRPADDDRESMIVCSVDAQHRWTSQEWSIVLGHSGTEGVTVDTAAAAVLLRIDERSLRQLVSRGRIQRVAGDFEMSALRNLYGELWGRS